MSPELNNVITHYYDLKGGGSVNHEALPVVIDDLIAPRWQLHEDDPKGITQDWQDLLSRFRDGIGRSLGDGSLRDNVSRQRKGGLIRPRIAAAEKLSVPLPMDHEVSHLVRPSLVGRTHFPKFVARVRESLVADNADLWPEVAAQVEEVLRDTNPTTGQYTAGDYQFRGGQWNDVASVISSGGWGKRNPADIHAGIPEGHDWRQSFSRTGSSGSLYNDGWLGMRWDNDVRGLEFGMGIDEASSRRLTSFVVRPLLASRWAYVEKRGFKMAGDKATEPPIYYLWQGKAPQPFSISGQAGAVIPDKDYPQTRHPRDWQVLDEEGNISSLKP